MNSSTEFFARRKLASLILVIVGICCSLTTASPQAELIGVWEAEQEFVSNQPSSIVISRAANRWIAKLDGQYMALTNDAGRLDATAANAEGKFRGAFVKDLNRVTGFWIQPANRNHNFPFANPVHFVEKTDGWEGRFERLHDRIRLYLCIYKPADRPLEAFIRNPERNVGIRLGYLGVKRTDDDLELLGLRSKTIYSGCFKSKSGKPFLEFNLPYSNRPFVFKKAERTPDSAFFATHDSSVYTYQKPEQIADGWKTKSVSMTSIDVSKIEQLIRDIRSTKTNDLRTPYIHSLLISINGRLVIEEYFYGHHRAEPHDTRSAGKSVASMLVGAVMDHDEGLNENRTLATIFGEDFVEPEPELAQPPHAIRSQWRRQITLGHALAMQSGLDVDDNNYDSRGSEDRMQNQSDENDWVAYAMKLPMIRQPGEQSVYGSNNFNLAVAALAYATKKWVPQLFAEHLAEPLEIKNYHFNLDPAENGYMGGGICLTARDQLKLGQVMLNEGLWNGRRILSESWVKRSLQPHGSIHEANDYGYGWWLKSLTVGDRQVDVFHAGGNGGQLIVCIPEHDMVVQMSGGNYADFSVWYKNLTELIPQRILSALK